MKKILCILVFLPFIAQAQQQVIPLYAKNNVGISSEKINAQNSDSPLVYQISEPSLIVFKPDSTKSNGTGIIVAPGGGFMFLSIKTEGYDVANWLVEKGFTIFLLKYRTFPVNTADPLAFLMDNYNKGKWEDLIKNQIPKCTEDGRNAIEYVRKHANEYHLNPNKIGIIGFSAGGTVAATSAIGYSNNNKPDFVAPIYPYFPDHMFKPISTDAPPMFLLAATNDEGGFNLHCINLYKHWFLNKNTVELHLYANGGHGFGMLKHNLPKDNWIELFYDFLQSQGFANKKGG